MFGEQHMTACCMLLLLLSLLLAAPRESKIGTLCAKVPLSCDTMWRMMLGGERDGVSNDDKRW